MINRNVLIGALFLLALGALSLHLRIHPIFVEQKPMQKITTKITTILTTAKTPKTTFNSTNFLAGFFCFVDLILVTWLFSCKNTAAYAFLLNGMIVILGIILMGHFTVARLWGSGASLMDWLYFKSTLADIIIASADFLVGKAVYDSYQV